MKTSFFQNTAYNIQQQAQPHTGGEQLPSHSSVSYSLNPDYFNRNTGIPVQSDAIPVPPPPYSTGYLPVAAPVEMPIPSAPPATFYPDTLHGKTELPNDTARALMAVAHTEMYGTEPNYFEAFLHLGEAQKLGANDGEFCILSALCLEQLIGQKAKLPPPYDTFDFSGKAIRTYEVALTKLPGRADLHSRLGQLALREAEKAAHAPRPLSSQDASKIRNGISLAQEHLLKAVNHGYAHESIPALKRLVQKFGGDAACALAIYDSLNNSLEKEQLLQRVTRNFDKSSVDDIVLLARKALTERLDVPAMNLLSTLENQVTQPTDRPGYHQLVGDLAFALGLTQKALQHYHHLLDCVGESAAVHQALGQCYALLFSKVVTCPDSQEWGAECAKLRDEHFSKALNLTPQNDRAGLHALQSSHQSGLSCVDIFAQHFDQYYMADADKARQQLVAFSLISRQHGASLDSLLALAYECWDLKESSAALRFFTEALERKPQSSKIYCEMATLYGSIGRFPAALGALQTALELESTESERWPILNNLATTCWHAAKSSREKKDQTGFDYWREHSLSYFDKALAVRPKTTMVKRNRRVVQNSAFKS